MKKEDTLRELTEFIAKNFKRIPAIVLEDVDRRVTDCLASGAKNCDPYFTQQLRYLQRVLMT